MPPIKRTIQNSEDNAGVSKVCAGWHLCKIKLYQISSNLRLDFHSNVLKQHPFPLRSWELRIVSERSSLLEVITLGCFLIATMAPLRFRDLLRSKPEALSTQGHILRGISWRTKTSVSGQPWGVFRLGVTTRPSAGHWVFRFLEALYSLASTKVVNTGVSVAP